MVLTHYMSVHRKENDKEIQQNTIDRISYYYKLSVDEKQSLTNVLRANDGPAPDPSAE
jgi:hypothetical protein